MFNFIGRKTNMKKEQSLTPLLLKGNTSIILVVLLVIASFLIGSLWTRTQFMEKEKTAGKVAGTEAGNVTSPPQAPDTKTQQNQGPTTEPIKVAGVVTYSQKKDAKICKTNGKPNIYLFSTTWCPHCKWIKDTFEKVVKEYVDAGKINAYHWEIDINDNALTATKETEVPKGFNEKSQV